MSPDDFQDTISNDKHLPRHLPLPADQVPRRVDEGLHLQDKVVQELRLALLEDRNLNAEISANV